MGETMRALFLIASAALALAACGRKDGDEAATSGAGDNLTAEAISANDTTAIDAATGEDANMAADADLNMALNELGENAAGYNASNDKDDAGNGSDKASNASTNDSD
jgi:hypothetical protein